MTELFSIFICYLLVHMTAMGKIFARIKGFESYQRGMMSYLEKWIARIEIRQMIIVLFPLILFALLLHRFSQVHAIHWLYFIASTLILLYGWSWSYRKKELVISALPQPQLESESPRFIFSQALSRPVPIIFWFVILGPWGVLLYDFIRRSSLTTAKQILEWPAARILGLGYALAGYFPATFSYWSLNLFKNIQYNQLFLEECGLYALNINLAEANSNSGADPEIYKTAQEAREAKALIKRAEWMLVIMLIILIVGGILY